MNQPFSHKIITDVSGLAPSSAPGLEQAWDRLAMRRANPLLRFSWFYSCAATVHADDELRVIVVYKGDEVSAIGPLVLSDRRGHSRLEIIGTSALYEPSGLLYSDRESLRYLLERSLALGYPVCLLRIAAGDETAAVAAELPAFRAIRILRDSAASVFLDLGDSWERLVAGLSSNRRYDFKRKLKRAEAVGPVTFTGHRPSAGDFPKFFEQAVAIEHASWKGAAGSSLQSDERLYRFFDSFLRKACDSGQCRFFFLEIGGTKVAMQIALEAEGACWILKQGYLEKYARLSPGVQLTHYSLRNCIENGVAQFEFLGSEESWQSAWPIERHAYKTILLVPYSVSGFRELGQAAISTLRARWRSRKS